MSHTSSIFESQPIQAQNLNGFDLSHIFAGTSKCGQLVPVLRKLLMQNSKISVGAAVNVELPPLATNFFGRIDFCIELFFCPCSVLYGGWRQFISNQVATMFPSSQDSILQNGGYALPTLNFGTYQSGDNFYYTAVALNDLTLLGTNDALSDYLGVRHTLPSTAPSVWRSLPINMLPFLAYHKIVDVFYRNCSTTKTWFAVNPNVEYPSSQAYSGSPVFNIGDSSYSGKNVSLVWHSFYTQVAFQSSVTPSVSSSSSSSFETANEITFPDGVSVLETRQRTYERDYFTAGSVTPQQGNPATLQFTVDAQGDGEFSVHALRSIVALQRFEEKLNYDPSYRGVMRNLFGSSPSDALLDEPSYIGRLVIPVYQKSVYNTSGYDSPQTTSNPYTNNGILGSKGASGSFSGEGQFCKNYKVGCFGYLMALASLVPHAMYGYGIDKEMLAKDIGDFPFPDLQTVGMDSTKLCEIYADADLAHYMDTFNYLPRYSWMKYKNDQISGELRPGKTLDSFVLQRVFASAPAFGTDFVTIAQTDLDGVFASDVTSTNLSCWFEIYWVFKAVMPLAAFCIPTLGELHDVHTIKTTQGGSRL